jgi:hypothetical protein
LFAGYFLLCLVVYNPPQLTIMSIPQNSYTVTKCGHHFCNVGMSIECEVMQTD